MKIRFIQAYSRTKHYGRELNEMIKLMPKDDWICVRDLDTMFLFADQPELLYQAIEEYPDTALFTCDTNRVWKGNMFADTNVLNHIATAKQKAENRKYSYMSGVIPAFFWLFPRATWERNPFDNHPILWPPRNPNTFDTRWTRQIKGPIRKIEHLYIWHTYRIDKASRDYQHLC